MCQKFVEAHLPFSQTQAFDEFCSPISFFQTNETQLNLYGLNEISVFETVLNVPLL